MGSSVDLGGMDQEGVTEITRPRRAGGQDFIATSSLAVVQVSWAQTRFSSARKQPGNVQM